MRSEWQGDEFAILVTREEIALARQQEALLDILVSEEMEHSGGDLTEASIDDILSRADPRFEEQMSSELQRFGHTAAQALQLEISKGGTPAEIAARFREHFDRDSLDLRQSLSEIISREAIAYDDLT